MFLRMVHNSRAELFMTISSMNMNRGVEVGAYNGEHALVMKRNAPNINIILVDPYKHYPKEIYNDMANDAQHIMDLRYEMVKCICDATEGMELWRMTSLEAAQKIEDNSLDFVYIDANHKYASVYEDILTWGPKVKKGGYICGHDFEWTCLETVCKAVLDTVGNFGDTLYVSKFSTDWFIRKDRE